MGTAVLALSLLAVALVCPATATLRIGAFNIQAFGDSKMSDEAVAGVIINVSTAGAAWGRAVCMEPKYSSCARDMAMAGRLPRARDVLAWWRAMRGMSGTRCVLPEPLWGHLPQH